MIEGDFTSKGLFLDVFYSSRYLMQTKPVATSFIVSEILETVRYATSIEK